MSLKGLEQLFENLDGLWSWEVEEGLCHFSIRDCDKETGDKNVISNQKSVVLPLLCFFASLLLYPLAYLQIHESTNPPLKGTFLNRFTIVKNAYIILSFAFKLITNKDMSKTKLTINDNGSVKIEGDFEIVDKHGNAYGLQERTVLSICRCGLSQNKPFCDGAHKGHFEHNAVAFDLPPKKV